MNLLRREPTLALTALKAALVVAVAFGLPLTTGQTEALLAAAAAVLALGAINRQLVTPVASNVHPVSGTARSRRAP